MKKIKKIIAVAAGSLLPLVTLAQVTPTPVKVPQLTPLDTFDKTSAFTQIGVFVNWIVALVGVAALVFLMYGAYMYMSSGRNEDNLKKAKASVTYGIIGAVVAILAFSIFFFASSLVK